MSSYIYAASSVIQCIHDYATIIKINNTVLFVQAYYYLALLFSYIGGITELGRGENHGEVYVVDCHERVRTHCKIDCGQCTN